MDDELELPQEMETMLKPGVINISQELGCFIPLHAVVSRINRYFSNRGFGYRAVSGDTFKLRIRPRAYPVFGSFVGLVHIYEKLGHGRPNQHIYRIEGLLRYRVSAIWFIGVFSAFFLATYVAHPGFWAGALFLALASGITLFITYHLGRRETADIEERLHASFLELRSTIQNLR